MISYFLIYFLKYHNRFSLLGGADNEILVWKAKFVQVSEEDTGSSKSSTKTKIRPSMAGGLQGVDVKKIVASSVTEDRQDIEEASIKSKRSTSFDELELSKKAVDMQISEPLEQMSNTNKSVSSLFKSKWHFHVTSFFFFN